ncbi:MAG TPA: class I SAM-dependent methyltransferase [Jatrophihabitantaceae bacterium]|jgi:2-polyprenyl-3-methyl-5-hydroxy-6-metoxy-1,4-benzoquinol methylase
MTTQIDAPPEMAAMEKMFQAGVATLDVATVYLGDQLGLYRSLDESGPATSQQLAQRLHLDERYVREWLTAQAISGWVGADGEDPSTAIFGLAPGTREVLIDPVSPVYLAPIGSALAALARVLPLLLDAFRTGAGVPYAAYGEDAVLCQAALNRPAYVNELIDQWLPALPHVNERLWDTSRPARVADLCCGGGWALIELAKAMPHLRLHGFDSDEASIALARRNAEEHGVAERVTFAVADLGADGAKIGQHYDLITIFEALHDLAHPVAALRNARRALAPGGTVLVVEDNVADTFDPPTDDLAQRFFASASVLWCLPQGRTEPDSAATGTLMRLPVLRSYAQQAGWSDVIRMPLEHPFFRFYELSA